MFTMLLILGFVAIAALLVTHALEIFRIPLPQIGGKSLPGWAYYVVYAALLLLVTFIWFSTIQPGGSQIAQLDRVYFCKPIEDGRNVALPGECGRQAEIMMPGLQYKPFINLFYRVSYFDMVDVADGHYAVLSAKDGIKLVEGQVAAKPWLLGTNTFVNEAGKQVTGNMLDAVFFLTDGMGHKGPQTTLLTPGRYAVNNYLWDIGLDTASDKGAMSQYYVRKTILPGFVGVVKSAISEDIVPSFMPNNGKPVNCSPDTSKEVDRGQIKAVLVPVGCRGVWKDPLPPGNYFINTRVYEIVDVDTRLQNWTYQGGYTRRIIDLTVAEDGTISQALHTEEVEVPREAAGPAITIKVEGWNVNQEIRLQARVRPEDAPLVVAAVGGPKEVEDRTITPQISSVLRNVGGGRVTVKNTAAYEEAKSELDALNARLGVLKDANADVGLTPEQRASEIADLERQIAGLQLPDPTETVTRPTRVLDFQDEREALEALVASDIKTFGDEAGIEIVNVTFGNADIPPELLVARKIEQLSGQLRNAYLQKRIAQVQRQATEAAKARADQQASLVTAQIRVDTTALGVTSRQNEGVGEQKYLEALAEGQKAQVGVLGQDRVLTFNIVSAILAHPEVIAALHLPSTLTIGQNGGGMDSLATILSATKFFGGPATAATQPQQ